MYIIITINPIYNIYCIYTHIHVPHSLQMPPQHVYVQMNTCTCGQSVCDERGPGLLVELHGVM